MAISFPIMTFKFGINTSLIYQILILSNEMAFHFTSLYLKITVVLNVLWSSVHKIKLTPVKVKLSIKCYLK